MILFVGLIVLIVPYIMGQRSAYKLNYKPDRPAKNIIALQSVRTKADGESTLITNTFVSHYWLEVFVNEQIKKGIRVAYDQYNEESDGEDFIVLTKNGWAIAMFDHNDKAYLVAKHKLLPKKDCDYDKFSCTYLKVFYGNLPLEIIKKKLGAEYITPLSEERLEVVIKTLYE